MSKWGWKGKDGKASGLLYEPGNWGDLLKHLWVLRTAQWMLRAGDGPFAYMDTFAGAPTYPLSQTVRRRLHDFQDPDFLHTIRPYLAQEYWPSAATLVADALTQYGATQINIQVFDQDEERRKALQDAGRFTILPYESGWDVLQSPPTAGLLMVDPYDILEDWKEHLPGILRAVEGGVNVLLYLYNRSGRSSQHFRRYRKFRNALEDGRGEKHICIGRVPADAFLPNSFHEMILLPNTRVEQDERYRSLIRELRDVTNQVVEVIRDAAVFEEF